MEYLTRKYITLMFIKKTIFPVYNKDHWGHSFDIQYSVFDIRYSKRSFCFVQPLQFNRLILPEHPQIPYALLC